MNFRPRAEEMRRQRIAREISSYLATMARISGSSALENIRKAIAATDEDEFFYYRTTAKMDARDAFTFAAMSLDGIPKS